MNLLLNLGSGQRPFEKPWINVDVQDKWGADVVASIDNMPMFEDNSADIIVLHHVLEHFGCGEADGALKEAWRILKPGGSLLVFVPNLRALARHWLTHEIDDYIFMVNVYGAYNGDEADRHKWGYDTVSLVNYIDKLLESKTKLFDFRTIPGADFAQDWWITATETIKEKKNE